METSHVEEEQIFHSGLLNSNTISRKVVAFLQSDAQRNWLFRRAERTCLMFQVERNEWGRPAGVTQTNERLLVCACGDWNTATNSRLIEEPDSFIEELMDLGSDHTAAKANCRL